MSLKDLMESAMSALRTGDVDASQYPNSREQRISFVYGNCAIDDPLVTEEVAVAAVDKAILEHDYNELNKELWLLKNRIG